MKYDLKGHPKSYKFTFCQKHSSTFVYGPILMKFFINTNEDTLYNLKCNFYVT